MVRDRAKPNPTSPSAWGGVVALPENRSALRAVQRIASGRTALPSPLTLHGPPGVGKSAAVAAMVSEYLVHPKGHTVRHLTANELPRATRGADVSADLVELEDCDLFVVEDLQHLPPRDVSTLCQLLDQRQARRLPVVLTATAGPAGLDQFPRRLTNRLASGLVIRLDMPGVASRRILTEHFAADRSVRLAPDAVDWMARAADGVRPLIGFLERLKSVAKGYPAPLTRPQVEEWLLEPVPDRGAARLRKIVQRVASAYQVKAKEVLGPSRLRTLLLPRQVAMTLARELTALPLTEIGKHFGGRDHTTVMHAIKKIEALAEADATFARSLEELRGELE